MPSSEIVSSKDFGSYFSQISFIQIHIGSFVTKVAKIHQVKKSNTAD
jgi:hypothetical protein